MSGHVIERMAVEVDGEGSDAVIFVHGLGGTANCWTPQLAVVRGRMRAIRPDLPGSGRSPLPVPPLSIGLYVDSLLKMAAVLGIERAHLAGHSLGSIICFHMAERQPNFVRSLALMGPLLEPPEAARQGIRDRAAKVRAEGMLDVAEAVMQGATARDTRESQPAVAAFVRELVLRQDAEGYARSCEALAAAKAADLSRIRCKTLLVTGEDDPIAPPQAVRTIAAKLEGVAGGAQVEVLPRCGHWTTLERAAEVNALLKGFWFGRS